MDKRFITIREVAADAGVGTATVSRVLNEPWRVSPGTRDRVNESISRLGYKPNFRARLLARGNSGTICFLLSNRPFIQPVHAQILQGAARQADAAGVQIVYATCTYSPSAAPSEIRMPGILAARGLIDGVIVAGTNYPNMLRALDELDLPYVVFGNNIVGEQGGGVPNAVCFDDESGGRQATRHLLALGHTRIRYIGDMALPWYARRYAGYAMAMAESGLPHDPPGCSSVEGDLQMGFDAVNEMCDRGEHFTAVFIGGDLAALGAIRALRNRGMTVPRDVSVVGFDDQELAQVTDPPLTTVRVPTEEVGAQCVLILNEMTRNGAAADRSTMLPVQLVLRESTAPLRS